MTRHFFNFRLTFAFSIFIGLSFSLGETPEIEKLAEGLNSADFEVRNDVLGKLWESGKAALPTLRKLADGEDPEMAVRASEILRKMARGIRPDTPADDAKQLEAYFEASDVSKKEEILEVIIDQKRFGLIGLIASLEKGAEMQTVLEKLIKSSRYEYIDQLLGESQIERALEMMLDQGAFSSLRRRAIYLREGRSLGQEIKEAKDGGTDLERERYLMALRVKGDAEKLRLEGIRLKDIEAEAVAALSMGDLEPWLRNKNRETIDESHKRYLAWVEAKLDGRADDAASIELALVKGTAEESPKNKKQRASVLLKMGLIDAAEDLLKTLPESWFYYVEEQKGFQEVREILELPAGEITAAWCRLTIPKLFEDVKPDRTFGLYHARFFGILRCLSEQGLHEEASLCMLEFARLPGFRFETTQHWLFKLAPEAFVNFAGRMIEAGEVSFDDLISEFYDFDGFFRGLPLEIVKELFERLKKQFPEAEAEAQLRLILSIVIPDNRYRLESLPRYEILVGLPTLAKALDRQTSALVDHIRSSGIAGFLILDFLAESTSFYEMSVELFIQRIEGANQRGPDPSRLADLYFYGRDYQKAWDVFEKIDHLPNYGPMMFNKALIARDLDKAGADELLSRAFLAARGNSTALTEFAKHEAIVGNLEGALKNCRRALLQESLRALSSTGEYGSPLLPVYAEFAFKSGNWQLSRVLNEALLSNELVANYSDISRARSYCFLAEAAQIIEAGGLRADAETKLRSAYWVVSKKDQLTDDFFPHLRKLGFSELHDELYKDSIGEIRKEITQFPLNCGAKNDFARLSALAMKSLDEAEEMMKEALRLRPHSAAYLDTMAEIFFARGDRAKAIEWGRKAIQTDPYDDELQRQFTRFLKGKIPSR